VLGLNRVLKGAFVRCLNSVLNRQVLQMSICHAIEALRARMIMSTTLSQTRNQPNQQTESDREAQRIDGYSIRIM